MPPSDASSETLSIRCPSCRQRFTVDGNLRERMVECGACDSRFRITEEVILRTKKFYPGEREKADLNRFQRVPISGTVPEGLQTMRYAEFNHPERLEPMSAQRIIAGIIGVSGMCLIALMLIFSSSPGAAFGSMPLTNKLVIAGFVSALGVGLLAYANPKARAKASFFGLLLAAGLLSLPFVFKGNPIALTNPPDGPAYRDPVKPLVPVEDEGVDPVESLKERFTTRPLEAEQGRLKESDSGKKAYGIYLTDLLQRNIFTVRDYLIRETMADPSSHPYPRDRGDYLMVLTGVSMDIEEVAEIAGKLGTTKEVHPEVGVVVVSVNNEHFVDGSEEKLNNRSDPAFYELNRRELASLDLERVRRAVERLAASEPKIYREDISKSLIRLMTKPGVRFHEELAKALLVWADDGKAAAEAAFAVLRPMVDAGEPVSENLVALVTKEKLAEAVPAIHALWLAEPVLWEKSYAEFGSMIESSVIDQLDTDKAPLRHSSIKLLEQVGTEKSLPELRKALASQDPETRVLAQRAIGKISAP